MSDQEQPETLSEPRQPRRVGGIPLRAIAPNAITALALCFGLAGVRFGFSGEWTWALGSILFAGVLDGVDGRVARLLKSAKAAASDGVAASAEAAATGASTTEAPEGGAAASETPRSPLSAQ